MQLSWASWRLFTLACAVPSLLVTVTFVFMPESPKFLVCQVWCPLCSHTRYHSYTLWQGRHEEALELLRCPRGATFYKERGGEYVRARALVDVLRQHTLRNVTYRIGHASAAGVAMYRTPRR